MKGDIILDVPTSIPIKNTKNPRRRVFLLPKVMKKSILLCVEIFRTLTIDEAVEFLADESGASPEYKDQLIGLIDYLKIVGLVSVDGNTVSLVKATNEEENPPANNPNTENSGNPASENTKKNPNAVVPTLPPFIQGLLEKLPLNETEWDLAQRAKWLQTAANIFDLMFEAKDKGTIDITFKASNANKQAGVTEGNA